jgi:hypothetical protein
VVLSQSSFSAPENDLVTMKVKGSISINLACTMDCGNCCTGQLISNTSTNISIGSSDVELTNYADEPEYWINGYYYTASGSCKMGTCSLFHITSINKDVTVYNSKEGELSIPSVSIDNKQYKVILNAPYSIEQAIEIVGQGSDCSEKQQYMLIFAALMWLLSQNYPLYKFSKNPTTSFTTMVAYTLFIHRYLT